MSQEAYSSLLFEIGAEEIPAAYIAPALDQLGQLFATHLEREELAVPNITSIRTEGSPRRLVTFVSGLRSGQEDRLVESFGPALEKSRDSEGKWTAAALGFARSHNVDISKIEVGDKKGRPHLRCTQKVKGQPARTILKDMLPRIISLLRFPKSMRWDEDNQIRFARPIRSILAVLDDAPISFSLGEIKSGSYSFGHRFLHGAGRIRIPKADFKAYLAQMKKAGVIVCFEDRQNIILKDLKKHGGARLSIDPELLAEVANLVENPRVFEGQFDKRFLTLPADVPVSAMTHHQRYFPVVSSSGKLRPKFLFAANGALAGASQGIVRGNEKVLAARLSDAEFFWREDVRTPLYDKAKKLQGMIFQKNVGTYFDKQERVGRIVSCLGTKLGLSEDDSAFLIRAAELSKIDLVTHMVGEFPELQGVMGREYALFDGEAEAVARAIAEQYLPQSAGGLLPTTKLGAILAIADKLDTIASCFRAGLAVTGSKDPYALRRQGLGIIRIVRAFHFEFSIPQILEHIYGSDPKDLQNYGQVVDFLIDRISVLLKDEGIRYDVVSAVASPIRDAGCRGGFDISLFIEKSLALHRFSQTKHFLNVTTAFSRATNIVKQAGDTGHLNINESLLREPAEKTLHQTIQKLSPQLIRAHADRAFDTALKVLGDLRAPIDRFFEDVLVMDPNAELRLNRLALLEEVTRNFPLIADFRKIVTE